MSLLMLDFLKQQEFQLSQLLATVQLITICCSTLLHDAKALAWITNDPWVTQSKSLFSVFKSLLLVFTSQQHWVLLTIFFLETLMQATYNTVFYWPSLILDHSSFSFANSSLSGNPYFYAFVLKLPFHRTYFPWFHILSIII